MVVAVVHEVTTGLSLTAALALLTTSLFPFVTGVTNEVEDVHALAFGALSLVVTLASSATEDANVRFAGQTLAAVLLATHVAFFVDAPLEAKFALTFERLPNVFCVFPLFVVVIGLAFFSEEEADVAQEDTKKEAAAPAEVKPTRARAKKATPAKSPRAVSKSRSRSPTPKATASSKPKKSPAKKAKKSKSPGRKKKPATKRSKTPVKKTPSKTKTKTKTKKKAAAAPATPTSVKVKKVKTKTALMSAKKARAACPTSGIYVTKIKWGRKKYDGWIDFGDVCTKGKNKGMYEFHFSGYEDDDVVTWVKPEEMKDPLDPAEFSDDE